MILVTVATNYKFKCMEDMHNTNIYAPLLRQHVHYYSKLYLVYSSVTINIPPY